MAQRRRGGGRLIRQQETPKEKLLRETERQVKEDAEPTLRRLARWRAESTRTIRIYR